jgi:flagellar assembly factor FliW
MPRIQTRCFDELEYSPDAVFEFPSGLPGFEAEHAFVFLEQPATHPLMFMQSLSRKDVCFILLPVLAADRHYELRLSDEDLAALHFPAGSRPQIGKDILCAVTVCAADDQRPHPTVNLFAPILVNLKQKIGIQAVQTQYPAQHPLITQGCGEELATCS